MHDEETNLYYLMARYYHPTHGVFISVDPDPGDDDDILTQNGYTYANNNPVMMTDPDGHYAQFIIPAAKISYRLYKGYKAYKKVKGLKKATSGPGNYVIEFSDGKKYIGKGNLQRARDSAKYRSDKNGSQVTSMRWSPAKSNEGSLIKEYKLMKHHGFYINAGKNSKFKGDAQPLYNKISSPGRKLHYAKFGKY